MTKSWLLAPVLAILACLAEAADSAASVYDKEESHLRSRVEQGLLSKQKAISESHEESNTDNLHQAWKHRNLMTMEVTSSFTVRNDFELTASDLSGGLGPEGIGILRAYNEITSNMMDTMSNVRFVPNSASMVSIVDSPCPTNCRALDETSSRCQKISTKIQIDVDDDNPLPAATQQQVSVALRNLIHTGQFRPYLRRTALEIYNIQDNTQCNTFPGIQPNRPIRRPAGVEVGRQEALDDDLGLRFNKMPLMDGIKPNNLVSGFFPFGPGRYFPMEFEDAIILRRLTTSVSVIHPDDCDLCSISGLSPEELIAASKVEITYPSSDPTSPFWDELWEVIVVQLHRLDDKPVEDMMQLPTIWPNYDMEAVAEAVHDEFPGIHHSSHIQRLFGPGGVHRSYQLNCPTCAGIDKDIIPLPSNDEFLRGAVLLADIATWAIGVVGPPNFGVKWFVGRPRPEEVVWEIYNDRMSQSDGVPGYIVETVKQQFDLTKMEDFTAYPEGSPRHPSWPAMHAAASAASLWMAVVMDLSDEQWCDVKGVDYSIGYARTVAGVHYYTDTIAGLNIGQEVLARLLPGYLEEKYGSNPAAVAAKIERVRFDWNDYIDSDCLN